MKRVFVTDNPNNDWRTVKVVDTETGDVFTFNESREHGFHFSFYSENVASMGWKSAEEFIKKRLSAKRHNFEKDIIAPLFTLEEDYEKRIVQERLRLIRWGAWLRVQKMAARTEQMKRNREDQISKLCVYLKRYGLEESDARCLISM